MCSSYGTTKIYKLYNANITDGELWVEPRTAYLRTLFERLRMGTFVKPPCPGAENAGRPRLYNYTLAFTLQLRKITVKP
jgi:hypothetical protein